MRAQRIIRYAIASLVVLLIVQCASLPAQSGDSSSPPKAAVKPVTDDYYGTKVVDPYRYMENLKDSEVQGWMKAQDASTRSALAAIPGREQLLARIRTLDLSVPKV